MVSICGLGNEYMFIQNVALLLSSFSCPTRCNLFSPRGRRLPCTSEAAMDRNGVGWERNSPTQVVFSVLRYCGLVHFNQACPCIDKRTSCAHVGAAFIAISISAIHRG